MHSFTDGLRIGIAYQVSPDIAWLITVAVLAHDIADGVNTVALCLAADHRGAACFFFGSWGTRWRRSPARWSARPCI